jgi:polyferredoxin
MNELIQKTGLLFFIVGMSFFIGSLFMGSYQLTDEALKAAVYQDENKFETLKSALEDLEGETFSNSHAFAKSFLAGFNVKNEQLKADELWDQVIWDNPNELTLRVAKGSSISWIKSNPFLGFLLTFVLAAVGALMYILPKFKDGPAGIKNNGIFHSAMKNRGWLGILTGSLLITFYIVLYFFPQYVVSWTLLVDPVSRVLSGGEASQWFLYGMLYTIAMLVMGIRMISKYRHSNYQIIRTISVMFFQTAFAFIIPEILIRLNKPYFDFKDMWPLNYDFFDAWSLDQLQNSGGIGIFMLTWGITLFVIGVPVFTYFFGKRWYCSWVCGCGGLAETLGDPYRQLSDNSVKAWKVERYLIHGVLVFAVVMTAGVLYTYFTDVEKVMGIYTGDLRSAYGFGIGSVFAGVIGTGFYPLMGNRTWCRFGCPLAAYLGLVQKYKSRFRITTNGGQCISCGNCSTHCEMGIDVRHYAQRGQSIIRSSCVGCGVCSSVCPRGVLNLEVKDEAGRYNEPILIGNDSIEIADLPTIKNS